MRRALLKGGLLALGLLTGVSGAPVAQEPEPVPLPPKAVPLERHVPTLSDELMALARLGRAAPAAVPALAQRLALPWREGRVRVLIEADGPVPLAALGGVEEARSAHFVRAWVPLDQLERLARWPGVRRVRRPRPPQALGDPTSQALTPLGATLFHSFDVQGQGIKVAVIDIGFGSLAYAQQRGALSPGAIADFTDYSGQGDRMGNHGTAVALIVHQMAPKAQLYLKQVGDVLDLENAVEDAIRQGVRVINHSVGWTNTNFGDGTGFLAELAQRAQEAGILWVNAAGNHALNHWTGRYVDADRNRWADFPGSPEQALRVPAYFGTVIRLSLTWDEWPRTAQDLDLYLIDSEGRVVASSTDWQLGAEPPVESLEYFVERTDVYRVRVLGRRVYKPLRIKLFSDAGHPLSPNTPHGSLLAPADAPAVLAVGAVPLQRWGQGPQEAFSSLGPTSDGRIKPDLTGPDGTRNLLIDPFSGTSAAAPHVAGAAALLWSQRPEWDVFQLRAALLASARDLGAPGRDVVYGAGALELAPARPRAERALSAPRVRPGESLTVTLQAQMPAFTFGALELREAVPPGWTLSSDDPAFDPASSSWRWAPLTPGARVAVQYTLRVPFDQAPGRYRIEGTLNGLPVQGASTVEVLPPAPQADASVEPVRLRRRGRALVAEPTWPDVGVALEVYDLAGQLVFRAQARGGALRWNGLTLEGQTAANGVYLVRVSLIGRPWSRVVPVVWLR